MSYFLEMECIALLSYQIKAYNKNSSGSQQAVGPACNILKVRATSLTIVGNCRLLLYKAKWLSRASCFVNFQLEQKTHGGDWRE